MLASSFLANRLGLAGGLVLLATMAGCGEEPSYRLRWDVLPRPGQELEELPKAPGGPGVQHSNECTRVGVVTVQVTAWDEFGFVADQRNYPCFPREFNNPTATARGALLPPGQYKLVARGVRRNGVGWTGPGADLDCNDDGFDDFNPTPICETGEQCEPGFLSCDCRVIDVAEDETIILDDLVFDAPPECEDGIDNDQDGLVDGIDPGCTLEGLESANLNSAQFQLQLSLLGNNKNAVCSSLGLSQFALSLDGEELSRILCRTDPLFFTSDLPPGPHEFSVVGVGPSGDPVTYVESTTFEVPEGGGGFFDIAFDFADADFLEPIVASTTIPLSFESYPGGSTRDCFPSNGDLTIDAVRINVLGPRGGTLPSPVRLEDGTPLDGSVIPCPTELLRTQSLSWGGYLLEIEGLSAEGDVCFSTLAAPEPAGPGQTRTFRIPRPIGPVPLSCTECNDTDRPCASGECTADGICEE